MLHIVARGAAATASLAVLGGCMFFTPATGVCLGEHCRKFEQQRQEQANQPTPTPPQTYDQAPDFKLTFIGQWGPLTQTTRGPDGKEESRPVIDASDPDGTSTLRIAVGRPIELPDGVASSEGIRVVTLNRGFEKDDAEAKQALAQITRQSMLQNFEGEPKIAEGETTLGKKSGHQVAMTGPARGNGPTMRHIARATIHRGRGYIVLLSTLEQLYARSPAGYDGLFEGFEFKDADPTYPVPTPRPAQATPAPGTGTPAPGATGSPAAGGTAPATATPSPAGSPTATPSPSPAGTPTATPSPRPLRVLESLSLD